MTTAKIVAAIDFGTHGTGYAWSILHDKNRDPKTRQIKYRTQWDAQPVASAKNLSAILFDSEDQIVAWGYEAKRLASLGNVGGRFEKGFKMRLAGTVEEPLNDERNKATMHLITSYLSKIYDTAVEEIAQAGYQKDHIRWCLTVPAIWDDLQKQTMWKCAVGAGFPDDEKRLHFAIEPEAAAHYARISGVRTLTATGGRRASLMATGARFIVADCGGGTVDITAYRADAGQKLSEVGRDFGGAHGSEFLSRAFLDKVAPRLGGFVTLGKIVREKPTSFLELLDSWERAKLSVSWSRMQNLYVSIPTGIDRVLTDANREALRLTQDGIDDHIVLKHNDVIEIFESVVPEILGLIDRQIDEIKLRSRTKTEELVILVGGFGASPYLQERMAEHLVGRAEVLIPQEPAVAVLCGAAHFAYEPQTRARRSKYTYGCNSSMPFVEGIDPKSKLLILASGERNCSDRFTRFVAAGQAIGVDEEVTHRFHPTYPNQTEVLFIFHRSRKGAPRFVDEDGVDEIGELSVKYGNLEGGTPEDKEIKVTMFFGDTKIRVLAEMVKTGKELDAELDFESRIGKYS